ncbi:hypothetical protein MCHK_08960 [Mesorhizobium huakuii 7653R]|nr:hypothetical protein MCHK_08960 [Mesorhizobium huakuii 7653R]
MEQAPKVGELFRRNYARHEKLLTDSARARKRVLTLVSGLGSIDSQNKFVAIVQAELGIEYPNDYGWAHELFWPSCDISDFLSAITLFSRGLSIRDHNVFLTEVRRIFVEEHLQYEVDDHLGVHFLVDEQFKQLSDAALAGLSAQRFAASRHALDEALSNLGTVTQNGKALIRGVFEAVESAFLVVVNQPSVHQMNTQAIDSHLKPILLARYVGHPDSSDMVERLLTAFKAWVKSAHPFRHGAPFDQVHEAPLDVALLSATQGMGYLRYLAGPLP